MGAIGTAIIYDNTPYPREISIPDDFRHTYICGMTGSGKSTLLKNLIDFSKGTCVIDFHGDLVEELLDFIPPERINDTIYFNPADTEFHLGFNPLQGEDKSLIAQGVIHSLRALFDETWGASRLQYILNNTLLALLDHRHGTFLGINRMLSDEKFRKTIIGSNPKLKKRRSSYIKHPKKERNPAVMSFWHDEFATWSERYRTEVIAPIQNKVGQFLSDPMMRNILGQAQSSYVLWDATPFTRDMRKLRRDASEFFEREFVTKEWGEVKKQLLDRLNAILGNTVLMRIFTQPKSKIDLYKAINTGKTIVVDTSVNHLQSEGTSILGRFFIAMLFQAALRRTGSPGSNKPAFLYLDEAWQYLDDKLPERYNMARKYDLGLVLASQQITHFSSKSMTLRNAAFSSAILFGGRVSNKEDKELLAECGIAKEYSTSTLNQRTDEVGKPLSSEFYCRIEGKGGWLVTIPFYALENAPQLSDAEYKEMLEENRERFTEPVRAPKPKKPGVPEDVEEVVDVEGGQLLRKPKDKFWN